MTRRPDPARGAVAALAVFVLIALIAIPAMAAAPSGKPAGQDAAAPVAAATATPTPEPTRAPKPTKGPKPAKAPEADVTASGTVGTRTDADGRTEYTLTTGSTVRVLSAGPPWFWDDDNPLKAYVGKQVTVVGTSRAGDDEIDVVSVDGTAIREPGKPPWAGGWKAVGKAHPGWSQEKADRWGARRDAQAKRFGTDCWPPGHCKDASTGPDED